MAHLIFDPSQPLTLQDIRMLLDENSTLGLSEAATESVAKCRDFLDRKISESTEPIYGINTGFGALYNKQINAADL